MSENVILKLSFEFAILILDFANKLEQERKYMIARQILKSGTSIGANIREAQGAESKADFVHKLKIAYKEAEETEYWLLLCEQSPHYVSPGILKFKIQDLIKLLGKIISTTKNRYNKKI